MNTNGSTIKGVLFDLGGVLVRLTGLSDLAQMMSSADDLEFLQARWKSSSVVEAYETGRIAINHFATLMIEEFGLQVTNEAFIDSFRAWPSQLFPETIGLLQSLPSGLFVAALSNTNPLHWETMSGLGLEQYFQLTFLSFRMGVMKPHSSAFEQAIDGMKLRPCEILFFDDSVENVTAALQLGIDAHHVTSARNACSIIRQYGFPSECTSG